MNYGEIKNLDVANGKGLRVSLFVSGCTHCCKDCFNPETWDFKYGSEFTENTEKSLFELVDRNFVEGLTILGGEPMEPLNQIHLLRLIQKFKNRFLYKKTIWIYTGCLFEELIGEIPSKYYIERTTEEILNLSDVLVDGEFKTELKDISLKFRGSSNQRILDLKESMKKRKAVEMKI